MVWQLSSFAVRCTKPTPALPLNSSAVIDVGDKLIHHEERAEVNPAQRTVETTKWTKMSTGKLFYILTTRWAKNYLLTFALAQLKYTLYGWPPTEEVLKTIKSLNSKWTIFKTILSHIIRSLGLCSNLLLSSWRPSFICLFGLESPPVLRCASNIFKTGRQMSQSVHIL